MGVWRVVKQIRDEILCKPLLTLKASVPALLYLLQNTLYLVAVSNLSAPVFIV